MVVVLPLVPVTPSTRIANDGSPWKRAASGPSTARTDATRACGTSSGSHSLDEERDRAGRDRRRRVVVPVGDRPGMQQNSAPGRDLAAVVHDRRDLHGTGGPAAGRPRSELQHARAVEPRQVSEEVVQLHAPSLSAL